MKTGIVASERQHTGKPIRMSGSGRRVRRIGYLGSTLSRHRHLRIRRPDRLGSPPGSPSSKPLTGSPSGHRMAPRSTTNATASSKPSCTYRCGSTRQADQRDGAALAFVRAEPGIVQQVARDHTLRHLQHRRDQLGLRGQRHAQRDRQRQHPLAHRHTSASGLRPISTCTCTAWCWTGRTAATLTARQASSRRVHPPIPQAC